MSKYDEAVTLWRKWRVMTAADIDRHLDIFRAKLLFNGK